VAEERDKRRALANNVHGRSSSGGKFLDQLRVYRFLKMKFPERKVCTHFGVRTG
jgi:hypothetical protein